MNMNVFFENIVARYAHRRATIFNGREQTYRTLGKRVDLLASALQGKGFCPGDSVALLCGNSDTYLEIIFACARVGVSTEHLNFRLGVRMLAQLLDESHCKLLFVSYAYRASALQAVAELDRSLEIVVVDAADGERGAGYAALLEGGSLPCRAYPLRDEDIFAKFYTSGTTGKPKGILLSHRNIVASTLQTVVDTQWSSSDTFLYVQPMFHVSLSAAFCTLFCGSSMVIVDRYDPEKIPDLISKYAITRTGLVPQMIQHLIDVVLKDVWVARALKTLDAIMYAGAPMPPATLKKALCILPCGLYALYGMSEAMGTVALLSPEDHARIGTWPEGKSVPVGRAGLGFEIRILDEKSNDCAIGQVGEVAVMGDSVMMGYDDLALTREVLIDGLYHTGDVGFLDEEGFVYVVGRKHDMIISGGENIFPNEVEECIRTISTDIVDAAVVGVPDEEWGQVVGAAIVLDKGAMVSEADIVQHCISAIGSYKKPRKILFCDKIPHNDCGKVDRHEIVARMLG